MSARDPLHVQILDTLANEFKTRQRAFEQKAGRGLKDPEYSQTVGRIRELDVVLDRIEHWRKVGVDELDDLREANDRDEPSSRARRRRNK